MKKEWCEQKNPNKQLDREFPGYVATAPPPSNAMVVLLGLYLTQLTRRTVAKCHTSHTRICLAPMVAPPCYERSIASTGAVSFFGFGWLVDRVILIFNARIRRLYRR